MKKKSEWADRIKALEASGLKLADIAEKLGIPYSTASDIRSARTKAPTGMAAVRLFELHRERCMSPADEPKAAA